MTSTSKSSPHERAAALVDAALALQQAGDWDEALHTLTRAQALAPDYTPLHMLMGLIYQEQQRWVEAEARFRRVLELEADHLDALQTLGLLLLKRGHGNEGLELLQRHAAAKPGNSATLLALAHELLNRKRQDEALALYQNAWETTHSPEVGLSYGRLLLRLRRAEQASRILEEVVAATPTAERLVAYGDSLLLSNRPVDALPAFERAAALDPAHAPAWRGLVATYLGSRRLWDALEAAERLLAIDSGDCANWFAKANVLFALNRPGDVIEAARRGRGCASDDDPRSESYTLLLISLEVEALRKLERVPEARELVVEMRHRFPESEVFVVQEAQFHNSLDEPEQALEALDRAVEAGMPATGNLAPVRFETLHRLGRAEEAWEFIQPTLADRADRRLNLLADIGINLYCEGKIASARRVFEQLNSFAPESIRLNTGLGFILTGEGALQEAEDVLAAALRRASDALAERALILADLAYLYLLRGNEAGAAESLHEAWSLGFPHALALLRVAYWHEGKVQADFLPHPYEFVPLGAAVLANQVTLNLARGEAAQAAALASRLVAEYPDLALTYMAAGCERLAAGDGETARQYWQQALKRSNDPQQRATITAWLGELAD